jgi:hypothetical protein
MPHSLRAKIKGLRYKGIITDKDCERLCKALDNEDVLDKIRVEILNFKEKCNASDYLGCGILEIIDKHKGDKDEVN